MTIDPVLPAELAVLFPDGSATGRTLSVPLPVGHLVISEHAVRPACWLSDGPVAPGLWSRLRADQPRSGLWPLLVVDDGLPASLLSPDEAALMHGYDPATLLAQWWRNLVRGNDKLLNRSEWSALSASTNRPWPGLAPPGVRRADPDSLAQEHAEAVVGQDASARLLLVAADTGAAALTALGWSPTDDDARFPAALSAVVHAWEDRFGARVVSVDYSTLTLSVAAPPVTRDEAVRVAVEHFAFCPELNEETLTGYAGVIAGQPRWSFWWD